MTGERISKTLPIYWFLNLFKREKENKSNPFRRFTETII